MAADRTKPTFLVRSSYRQRRLRDVAWLLPVFGALLIFVPLLWPRGDTETGGTAEATIYLFLVWFVLIVAAAVLSRIIRPDAVPTEEER